MLDNQELKIFWRGVKRENGIERPKVYLAKCSDVWYYVLEDHRSVYFFMSATLMSKKGGDKGHYRVFAAIPDVCKITEGSFPYYEIEPGRLRPVSCTKDFNLRHELLQKAM